MKKLVCHFIRVNIFLDLSKIILVVFLNEKNRNFVCILLSCVYKTIFLESIRIKHPNSETLL